MELQEAARKILEAWDEHYSSIAAEYERYIEGGGQMHPFWSPHFSKEWVEGLTNDR